MHSSKRFSWLLGVLTLTVQAQTPPSSDVRDTVAVNAPEEARWGLSGYGSLNYFAFDWDTDPARRNASMSSAWCCTHPTALPRGRPSERRLSLSTAGRA